MYPCPTFRLNPARHRKIPVAAVIAGSSCWATLRLCPTYIWGFSTCRQVGWACTHAQHFGLIRNGTGKSLGLWLSPACDVGQRCAYAQPTFGGSRHAIPPCENTGGYLFFHCGDFRAAAHPVPTGQCGIAAGGVQNGEIPASLHHRRHRGIAGSFALPVDHALGG